ncbi:MAG: Hpt domain-containing protein [Myxococcales bacterium]|nr:Hpt domain-containing protein [Myxococcales bacterium]
MKTPAPLLGYSEIFDLSYLQEVTGGDPSLIESLVILFIEETSTRLTHLEEALHIKKCDVAIREAHTLKGSCSQLGEGSLLQAAIALESAVREHDNASTLQKLKLFQKEFARLQKALEDSKAQD